MMKKDTTDRLLSAYLLWGMVSVFLFIVFVLLLLVAVAQETTDMVLYFIMLLSGFLWIGATSVSRHVFVMLKRYIGKEISVLEFLSTQFIVLLFPVLYIKLRKEVQAYLEKEMDLKKVFTTEGTEKNMIKQKRDPEE
jgi:uncharacterized membrane protein